MSRSEGLGLMVGIVVDLNDPAKLGRVRVTYPQLGGVRSDWARLVSPMAGRNRGMVFRPEVNDEVLVGFLLGDPRSPYVLGAVWNLEDRPPAGGGSQKDNNWRFITSRSGHVIRLDDTAGKERIEVIDKSGACKVTIDSSKRRIVVTGPNGIEISAGKGTVKISGENVEIASKSAVRIKAGRDVDIKATTSLKAAANTTATLSGGQNVKVRGATVDIN